MTTRPTQLTDDDLLLGAIVYMRQSSIEQLRDHTGSTAIQRDLVALLQSWGFKQIDVIDEDLGVSGSQPGVRLGFNRLIALMSTGLRRLVAVTDTSRLTRNVLELAQFADVARTHNVLLFDGAQIVDFRDPTSEFVGLFLGLNAVRENRARAAFGRRARRKKAESGHATTIPPTGYVRTLPGIWIKDADPQVRDIIQLVFDKFMEIGSATGTARWFRRSGTKLPWAISRGRRKWSDATPQRIVSIVRNAAYAGVYVYGKTTTDRPPKVTSQARKRGVKTPRTEWVWIENHHEAYVPLDTWIRLQERLTENQNKARSPLGRGQTLLQGLLRCSIHDVPLGTFYPYRGDSAHRRDKRSGCYRCDAGDLTGTNGSCGRILAPLIDRAIEVEVLQTLTPPSLKDLQDAAREALRGHEALVRAREDETRRVDQAVAEAERAFDQVDEKHAHLRTRLAERLDDALRERKELKERHLLNPLTAPLILDENELTDLARIVGDLPQLWHDPRVRSEQRKSIVRLLIDSIIVTPRPETWRLDIHWVGGATTVLDVQTGQGIRNAIRQLHDRGLSPPEIAARLNEQGVTRPFGALAGTPHSASSILRILSRMCPAPRPAEMAAYVRIRQRFTEELSSNAIAGELKAEGFPHLLGTWTARRVDYVIRLLRQGKVPGVERLPSPLPLVEAVRSLHEAGLSDSEIAARLKQEGVLSRRRRRLTPRTGRIVLRRLGLRQPAPRSTEATVRKLRPVLRQPQPQNPATTASADGTSETTSA